MEDNTGSNDKFLETVRVDDKDWFLQMLVDMANKNPSIGVGLTLNVGGMIISGNLCNGKDYFYRFGESLGDAIFPNDKDNAQSVHEAYRSIGDDVYDDSSEKNPASYIHMMNAKFFSVKGDIIPSTSVGFLWRGKISSVDSFSLGSLSKD